MNMKTLLTGNLVHPSSRPLGRVATLLIALVLACVELSSSARADCQQGCDTVLSNTFLGDDALVNNTTGFENTASGAFALTENTIGIDNTANGFQALLSNTSGNDNTAVGFDSLLSNTTGFRNTATGFGALSSNTIGGNNTGDGAYALFNTTSGLQNAASGVGALFKNTTGSNNTASGFNALFANTAGENNIAIGASAGVNLTFGSNNIDIGNGGVAGESGKIRIGTDGIQARTFIAGISGVTVPRGVGVIVGTNGQLGTVVSSERFKDVIRPMGRASEAILALHPVTFRYKKELDPEGVPQFGLLAEEVEKVNPALVARDDQGRPYTVRYEAVNAMLLNEFLKQHCRNQQQERRIGEQQDEIEALKAELKEQRALIQKVSDKVELNEPAPQIVGNNH
jgi:hypothetical protein